MSIFKLFLFLFFLKIQIFAYDVDEEFSSYYEKDDKIKSLEDIYIKYNIKNKGILFIIVAYENDMTSLKLLVKDGIDINYSIKMDFQYENISFDKGVTALMAASFNNSSATLEYLLAKADLKKKDKDGWNALFWAIYGSSFEAVEILLIKGLEINSTDKLNWSALMWASFFNKFDMIELLLTKQADKNIKSKKAYLDQGKIYKEESKACQIIKIKNYPYSVNLIINKMLCSIGIDDIIFINRIF